MICLIVKFSQKTNYSFLKPYSIVLSSCKYISFLLHRNKGGVEQNNFEKTPLPLSLLSLFYMDLIKSEKL